MGANPHTPSLGMGKCEKAVLPDMHILCEHALPDKPTASGACGTGRLCVPIIRGYPLQEHAPDMHILCEHVLSGKSAASTACGTGRLCVPIIRGYPLQEHAPGAHILCEHALPD